jgi:hypothetical protein
MSRVSDVFEASLKLPTLVFTCMGAVCALLWLASFVGIVDVEGGEDAADDFADGALEPLGLAEVPILVLASILALVGWVVCVLAQLFLLDSVDGGALVAFAVGVGVVGALASIGLSVLVAPTLSKVFTPTYAAGGGDLVGRIAEIRSVSVSERAGYADTTWPDGRGERVDVRISEHGDVGAGELASGDRVLLVSWDATENIYIVAQLPEGLD